MNGELVAQQLGAGRVVELGVRAVQDVEAVDQLAGIFSEYMALFRTAEPTANAVANICPTFPAENPAVWAPNLG